jgi:hypothetical protein
MASGVSVFEPAPTWSPVMTSWTNKIMMMTGKIKDSTIVTISCFGVLMGEW